jgi:hypothetical protein
MSKNPYFQLIIAAPFMLTVGGAYALLPVAWDGALVWSAVGFGVLGGVIALALRTPHPADRRQRLRPLWRIRPPRRPVRHAPDTVLSCTECTSMVVTRVIDGDTLVSGSTRI